MPRGRTGRLKSNSRRHEACRAQKNGERQERGKGGDGGKARTERRGQTERTRASLSLPRASLSSFERSCLLVDANTARFDDPKPTGNRCGLKRRQQAPNQARQVAQRRYSRPAKHSYARRIARRESKHAGEVEVQRNRQRCSAMRSRAGARRRFRFASPARRFPHRARTRP
jgi:hypothetical protein